MRGVGLGAILGLFLICFSVLAAYFPIFFNMWLSVGGASLWHCAGLTVFILFKVFLKCHQYICGMQIQAE